MEQQTGLVVRATTGDCRNLDGETSAAWCSGTACALRSVPGLGDGTVASAHAVAHQSARSKLMGAGHWGARVRERHLDATPLGPVEAPTRSLPPADVNQVATASSSATRDQYVVTLNLK